MVSLWTCIQSFAALICCSLPVIYPILSTPAFWSRISSQMLSYASFMRTSRARTTKTKESSKHSGIVPVGQHQPGWKNLDEDDSTRFLAWPNATHQAETHALSDFPFQVTHPESSGIEVQRRFDVV